MDYNLKFGNFNN